MSDISATRRIEPTVEAQTVPMPPIDPPMFPSVPPPRAVVTAAQERPNERPSDQLARIEDKAARIEEKYARSEALLLRVESKVETATGVTGELARQVELSALADRVRRLPGYGALIFTAILAALGSAALLIAVARYLPGVLGR
jgi:hypothetical protein